MLLEALDDLAGVEDRVSVSRVTVRIVTVGEPSAGCKELLADRGFKIEASIPLSEARKLVVTYIAKCSAGRQSDANDVREEKKLIAGILAGEKMSPSKIVAEFDRLRDFRVQTTVPERLSTADFERLVHIHKEAFPTFPYDFRKKLGLMLANRQAYPMVLVRSALNEEICAFSNLELNTIELDDGTRLNLAEYDNTMRLTSCGDHEDLSGLGRILRLKLAMLAARNDADLCYAESRAGLAAINQNSHQAGMRFGGALEKHVLISGQSNIDYKAPSCFETMNVWYLNREDLMALDATVSTGGR